MGEEEKKQVLEVLETVYLNDGPTTRKFEAEVAKLLGCRHVIGVTNATSGMFLSLKAMGIGPGDEVIVPDITYIATANSVHLAGAKVVLVDIDKDSLTIDLGSLRKALTPRTKAVMPVHISGRSADMEGVMKIAKEQGICR